MRDRLEEVTLGVPEPGNELRHFCSVSG
jgi:hypothetical protein